MAEAQAFQDEVSRIVNASYQVSLQSLHDLVQKSDPRIFQQWAESKPCQIHGLASAVIEGLQQWPYALGILEQLAAAPTFRDSILRQSPLLIDTLLKQAQQSPQPLDKYSTACLAMLSSKLPSDVPVPASLENFFSNIIGAMVGSPSATTTRAVYDLVHSIGPRVLDSLSHDMLEKFVDVCRSQVGRRSDETPSARTAGILCLATFAIIICSKRQSATTPSLGSSTLLSLEERLKPEVWLRKVQDLFNPGRAAGTLNFVVAHLIAVFSADADLSPAKTLIHIKAAEEIIQGFDAREMKRYMERKAALITKLSSRVQNSALDPEHQIPAMLLVISMYQLAQLSPGTMIETLRNLIAKCVKEGRLNCLFPAEWSGVVKSFGPSFGQPLMTRVLRVAMLTAEVGPVSQLELLNLASSVAIVERLEYFVRSSVDIRESVQLFLSSEHFSGLWVKFANDAARPDWEKCELHGVCSAHSAELRRRRITAVCSLVLKAWPSGDVSALATQTALSPIDLFRHMSMRRKSVCGHVRSSKTLSKISIAEVESTPIVPSSSHAWEARLANNLNRQAHQSFESIIRSVGEVCRDLEERCATVEQPLRDMTIRFERAEAELEAMRKLVQETESKASERQSTIRTFESDNAGLQNKLNALHAKLESQREDLRSAQQKAAAAIEGADIASRNAEESIKLKELEVQAHIAAKDERIDAQQRDLASLRAQNNDLMIQLEQAKIEKEKALGTVGYLEQQMQSAEANMNDLRRSSKSDVEKVANLESEKCNLTSKIGDLNKELAQALAKYETLQSDVQDIKEAHARDLQNQDENHECRLLQASQEATERLSSKDRQIEQLNSALIDTEAHAAADTRIKEDTISKLQAEVKKLEKKRAKQVADTTKLFQNFLSSNSSTETPQHPVRRNLENSKGAVEQQTPFRDSPLDASLAAIPMPIPMGGLDGAHDSKSASSSSSNSGPTPKRAKPRRSHKTPVSKRTVRFSSVPGEWTNEKTPRRALEEVSGGNRGKGKTPNRQLPLQGHTLGPSTLAGLGLGNLEDVSFSDGDIFTSSGSREERGKSSDQHSFVMQENGMEIDDETADEL